MKICQKYKVMPSYAKKNGIIWSFAKISSFAKFCQVLPSFAKNMELYEVLLKYKVLPSFAKNMELCEVLPKI